MLKIFFGKMDAAIYNAPSYFDDSYMDEWITSDFAKQVIKDIDKSEVLNAYSILSPIFGSIPPTKIAGGTKTLLLMYYMPECVFNASNCGDNCAKWILKIAEEKDITINLHHLMRLKIDEGTKCEILILNNKKFVSTYEDYILTGIKYL